jgi:hypothetical protein
MFMLVEEPNRYELPAFYALHAWIWQENPSGVFESFNPDVTCANAMPNTAVPPARPSLPIGFIVGFGTVAAVAAAVSLLRRRRA